MMVSFVEKTPWAQSDLTRGTRYAYFAEIGLLQVMRRGAMVCGLCLVSHR